MMKQTNPYTQQAVTQAKQWANQNGMLNTSIASSAGIDAAIKNILPIAQQDASTLHSQAMANQKVVNEFLMQDYLTKSQFKLTEYGHMATTYNQGLAQAHQKNETALTRSWQTEQNKLDRELNLWRDKFNAEMNATLASQGYEHDAGMGHKSCVNNAMSTWQQAHANLVANRSSMSEADFSQQEANLAATRDHSISMCQ